MRAGIYTLKKIESALPSIWIHAVRDMNGFGKRDALTLNGIPRPPPHNRLPRNSVRVGTIDFVKHLKCSMESGRSAWKIHAVEGR